MDGIAILKMENLEEIAEKNNLLNNATMMKNAPKFI